ncbi:MAG TPA: hypothetical protein VFH47_00950 [Candidatus Thermoplasmatota archaeon]|nr:hypothetical protein [Candidatus Thermoplasmatota archaeon]
MTERDALGRPRKNLWAARREEVAPEAPRKPVLSGPAPESKVLYDSGWTDGVSSFLASKDPMAQGFGRFVQYVRQQRGEGRSDRQILESGARFVRLYPEAVAKTSAPFAAGMRAALQSFRAQVEDADTLVGVQEAANTPTRKEVEAAKEERRQARQAKQAAREQQERAASRKAAAKSAKAAGPSARKPATAKAAAKAAPKRAPAAARKAPAKAAGRRPGAASGTRRSR